MRDVPAVALRWREGLFAHWPVDPSRVRPLVPDSLDAFLAERYRLYLVRNGSVHCARVEHDPWRLCPAEAAVHADALLESVGLPAPADEPMVRYAPVASFTVRTPFRP